MAVGWPATGIPGRTGRVAAFVRHLVPRVAATVTLALAVGGCATSSGESAAQPTATSVEAAQSSAAEDHPLAFESVTTEGAAFDASSLAGQDVVLWFWAPWCTICRAEAPQVAAAADELGGDVRVVGVASSGTLEEMQAFVADTGADSFVHVADVEGDVWRQFGVVAQPTFVFVDDDGRSQTFAGGLSQAALVDAMRQLTQA